MTAITRAQWGGGTDDLIAAARAHDEDAAMALIEHCQRRIVAAIEIAGISRYDAHFDDAQNIALLEIWKQLPSLRSDSAICAWMHGITRRVTASRVVDPLVRQRRRDERFRSHAGSDALVHNGSADAISDRDMLGRVLGRLTVEHREVLVLRFIEGFSERETAQLLGIGEKTVSSRTTRAKRAAIDALNELESSDV